MPVQKSCFIEQVRQRIKLLQNSIFMAAERDGQTIVQLGRYGSIKHFAHVLQTSLARSEELNICIIYDKLFTASHESCLSCEKIRQTSLAKYIMFHVDLKATLSRRLLHPEDYLLINNCCYSTPIDGGARRHQLRCSAV
jgi:hypothetical protein